MSESIPGAEAVLEAYGLITGPRQTAYSHPSDDYRKVTDIFEALTGIRLTVDQALMFMIAVKMARLRTNLSQGTLHRDSLVDAIGYLGCLSAHLEREAVPGSLADRHQTAEAQDDPEHSQMWHEVRRLYDRGG
jgi:hypothetical protein